MKLLFENWRKFINEADGNMRTFVFSESELSDLNRTISKIVSVAKSVLGADGPVPLLSPKNLERTKLDTSQKDPAPEKMVAEGDVVDLRQRYYGTGGELEKSSPRSAKDLEKGLGQMSAQEFEETGYVMKVPQEVLDDFNILIEETKKTDGLYTQARDWYHNIRELLNQETNNDRDAALLGLLIAVYSPRAKFSLNLAEASFMFKAIQEDAAANPELLREYLETFVGAEKKEPGKPHGFTGSHKVPNFALNLIAPELAGQRDKDTGKTTYNDTYEWNSTIDTWMIDAFYPMLRKASTAKEWDAIKGKLMSNVVSYRYMARLVAQEARKFNLLPHELQAIIWVSMQIRQTGVAGLGVTTQFAFNQIKESIINIRTINATLESAKKELEGKSWLGTLFDEIDNKGFEEAAKFILGIKNEKGKITVPGVRSISASGKSGTPFKYYSEPEVEKKPKLAKAKKPAAIKEPKPKPEKRFADPKYSELKTYYVMNNVIQMPTGKFNNLYDAITLYLSPEFSSEKAVEYIIGRFDPEAKASSKYFKENKILKELAAGYSPHNPSQLPMRPAIGTQNMPPAPAATLAKAGEKIPADSKDTNQVVKAVIHRNSKVLLLKNEKGYDLPGGHLKQGESVVKGLQREIFEETGITIGPDLAKLYINQGIGRHFFVTELPSDDIHLSDEHTDWVLMPFADALKQTMKPAYISAIQKATEVIVGADSLRSRDDSARLTLTPDGSRQDRAPHAPMRRQTRPMAEGQEEFRRVEQLNLTPLARLIEEVRKNVVFVLANRYCQTADAAKCFEKNLVSWLNGAKMPPPVRIYSYFFEKSANNIRGEIYRAGDRGQAQQMVQQMGKEYARQIVPGLKRAFATHVRVQPLKFLRQTPEGAAAPMGHRHGSALPQGLIGVRFDLKSWYEKNRGIPGSHGWPAGFKKYAAYALYHEFIHCIDRELKISEKTTFRKKAGKKRAGMNMGYYDPNQSPKEFFAEWENIEGLLGGPPSAADIKMFCRLKKEHGGDFIGGTSRKVKRGHKLTKIDFMLESPLLKDIIDCNDIPGTFDRLQALNQQAEKRKQLAERRKRK